MEHALALAKLARDLTILYEATGDPQLLDEAIQRQREAVEATPSDSPAYPGRVSDLGRRLADRYALTEDRDALDEAVDLHRRAVASTSEDDPDLPAHLNSLGIQLDSLYAATGEPDLLDEALRVGHRALAVTPAESADFAGRINNYGVRLGRLYEASGDVRVLREALDAQGMAVTATSATGTDFPRHLNNLGVRFWELYQATGDRRLLDASLAIHQRVVELEHEQGADLAGHLNNLAARQRSMYIATGDRSMLDAAVSTQRRVLEITPPTSPHWPGWCNTLSVMLSELSSATGDRRTLEEAIEVGFRGLERTSPTFIDAASHLRNLGSSVADLAIETGNRRLAELALDAFRYALTMSPETDIRHAGHLNELARHLARSGARLGDRDIVVQAIEMHRRALDGTPESDVRRVAFANGLAGALADLYELTGDPAQLRDAQRTLADATGYGPRGEAALAETAARLLRLDVRRDDRFVRAAERLTAGLDAHRHEWLRLASNPRQRRDLAQTVDGLLGDLVTNLVLAGRAGQAIDVLESDRLWLTAPDHVPQGGREPVTVVWVAASRWETVVISTTTAGGSYDAGAVDSSVVGATRAEIYKAVPAAGSVARRDIWKVSDRVVEAFPRADRLLIIPLGVTALLPLAAARLPSGHTLFEQSRITFAPSLAWAQAVQRTRPAGPSFGVFHPGRAAERPLDLVNDQKAFAEHVGGRVLPCPTAEEVLHELVSGTDVGHFSCHAAYNRLTPLESALDLDTDLTIRAILDHPSAPWLVNLSACETAVPDLDAAEQLISFPTGFLMAGAAHVVATLWPVGNTMATIVNRRFYRHLAERAHPADALRLAVRHLRSLPPEARRDDTRDMRPVPAPDDEQDVDRVDWAPFVHYGSPW